MNDKVKISYYDDDFTLVEREDKINPELEKEALIKPFMMRDLPLADKDPEMAALID